MTLRCLRDHAGHGLYRYALVRDGLVLQFIGMWFRDSDAFLDAAERHERRNPGAFVVEVGYAGLVQEGDAVVVRNGVALRVKKWVLNKRTQSYQSVLAL